MVLARTETHDLSNLIDGATADEAYLEATASRENSMLQRVLAMRMRALDYTEVQIMERFGYLPLKIDEAGPPTP